MEILLPSASLYGIYTCMYGIVDGRISLLVPHVCVYVFSISSFLIVASRRI
jgi:hypothetical protein